METHLGRSIPAVRDFRIEGTWATTTPAKPNEPRQSLIYDDGQGGLLSQAWEEQRSYMSRYNMTQQNDGQTNLSYSTSSVERNNNPTLSNNAWGKIHETPSLLGRIELARESGGIQRRGLEEHLPNWNSQGRRSVMNYGPNIGSSSYPRFSSWDMPLPCYDNGIIGNGATLVGNFNDPLCDLNTMSFGEILNGPATMSNNGGAVSNGIFCPGWVSQPEPSRLNNIALLNNQGGQYVINQQRTQPEPSRLNSIALLNNQGGQHGINQQRTQLEPGRLNNIASLNNQGGQQGINQQSNGLYGRGMSYEPLPRPHWSTGMANLPPAAKHGNGSNVYAPETADSQQRFQRQVAADNAPPCTSQGPIEPLPLPHWSTSMANLPPTAKHGNGSNVYTLETADSQQRIQRHGTSDNGHPCTNQGPNGPLLHPHWSTGMANLPPTTKHGNGSNVYAPETPDSRQRIHRHGTSDNAHPYINQGQNETLSHPHWSTGTANLPPTAKHGNGSNASAPETPHSQQRIQRQGASNNAHPYTNRGPNMQNVLQESEVDAAIADLQENNNETISEPVISSSLPGKVSITIEESQNPEKGASQDIDLNKTPQKKARRRRYQPKVIRENKPKHTPKPKIPNPTETKDAQAKRKNVGRNKTNTPSTPPPGEATEPKNHTEPAVKSCKRSLNFEMNGQETNNRHPVHFMHEEDLVLKTPMAAFDLNITMNHELNEFISLPVQGNPDNSQNLKSPCSTFRGKANNFYQKDSASAWFPDSSPCASSGEGVQTRGSKRSLSYTTDLAYIDGGIGAITQPTQWQITQTSPKSAHTEILPQSFIPEICKKKRTEKIQRLHIQSTTFATASEDCQLGKAHSQKQVELMTSKYFKCNSTLLEINMTNNDNNQAVMRRSADMEQFTKTWADLSRFKKKRTKVVTRVRDMAPLTGIASVGKSASKAKVDIARGHYSRTASSNAVFSCTEALAAVTSETPRSKRRSKQQNSVNKNWNMVLYDKNRITSDAADSMLALPWRKTDSTIEDVTMLFQQLNINREKRRIARKEKAMIRYNKQDQNALVLYEKAGPLVPFEGPFNPIKKRRQRAKVELDDETTRVWRLLLENIDNQGIDGTDEDKAKWWDNERRVFRGRVDSFIARMRLVQGDRRFTPWKGSVLDSVIGVFLTQNVSDHLSSSAFMSMAARFPLKPESFESTLSDSTSALFPEPEVCIEAGDSITWNEKAMDQPTLGRNSRVIYDLDHVEEKRVINIEELTGKAGSLSPVECSSDSCQKVPDNSRAYNSNKQTAETQIPYILRDDQAREHATSPQSVISSQNSISSRTQVVAASCKFNYIESTASFMGLLKMAECSSQAHLQDQLDSVKHVTEYYQEVPGVYSSNYQLNLEAEISLQDAKGIEMLEEDSRSSGMSRKDENSPATEQSNLTSELAEQDKSLDPFPGAAQKTSLCYVLEGETMVMQSQMQKIKKPEIVIASAQAEISPSCKGINVALSAPEMTDTTETTRGLERTKTHNRKVGQIPKQVYGSGVLSNISNINPSHCSSQEMADVTESTRGLEKTKTHNKKIDQIPEQNYASGLLSDKTKTNPSKTEKGKAGKEKKNEFDWDSLRRDAEVNGKKPERTANTKDSLDWEAVRHANVSDIAETIKERGMNNMLAERIKDFLDRVVKDHGSIDMEWLRDIPPDKAKEYLLSFRGLGLKSVECIRLLTLHHLAFPVDTNVGRIAVRLGWVPLQPLPESLQLHLLEMYPILESIQKYLWPRLCKLDQKTLYELHYHMITFGKVFCTKRQPNCNACPLRGECRHFASAFASARFALPGPEEKSIILSSGTTTSNEFPRTGPNLLPLTASWDSNNLHSNSKSYDGPTNQVPSFPLLLPFPQNVHLERKSINSKCEPIVEVPASPEQEPQHEQDLYDIEDTFFEDPNEIPTINLNMEEFTQTLQNFMNANRELQEAEVSNAVVALKPEAASIPTPKLKNINRLRTEHYVYELPDAHPLLHGMEKREPDDPCSYLLAIWTPGETANSIDPPARKCSFDDPNMLCSEETCSYCSSQRESDSQIVRGTLLIPTRTAMRGSFPLNGTYFQVNEVFADHASSLNPIAVPRSWLWNLPRRTVYFGTSIPTIFKGLNTEDIQHCFWRGYVCVRGFDQKTRAPRPLMARLHFPASRMARGKGKVYDE